MSTREEMIAHGRTVEEIADELGADSLAYLSMEGVYEAIGTPAEHHCDACFTGNYPLGDGGEGNGKFALEEMTPRRLPRPRLSDAFRIAVLASGAGTNLQAILDRLHGRDGIEVVARGLQQARRDGAGAGRDGGDRDGGLRARGLRRPRVARRARSRDWLAERGVDLIVLAGYMELLSARVRARGSATGSSTSTRRCCPRSRASMRSGRRSTHGVKVTGVTVHFVDEGVDSGPIILQRAVEVPSTLATAPNWRRRSTRVEHELLPEAIRLIAAGAVRIDAREPATRPRRCRGKRIAHG